MAIKKVNLDKTDIMLRKARRRLPQGEKYQGKLWDMLAREFAKLLEEKKRGQ